MSWMTNLKDMRDCGWVITTITPDLIKGFNEKDKAEIERTMLMAAINIIEKIKEGKNELHQES